MIEESFRVFWDGESDAARMDVKRWVAADGVVEAVTAYYIDRLVET